MSIIAVFQFDDSEIRFVDDKPVANDVAAVLGYKDPANAVNRLVKETNKGVCKLQTPGGIQSVTVLEEPGIYQLIFGSKLPAAERFQDWVFNEVLPSIRKTGQYSMGQSPVKMADKVSEAKAMAGLIDDVFSGVNIKKELVAGLKINFYEKVIPESTLALEESRQLLIVNTAQEAELLTPTEIGKRLGISGVKVNKLLIERGFQVKNENSHSKKDPTYIPVGPGIEFSDFTLATGKGTSDTYQQLRWYASIIDQLG